MKDPIKEFYERHYAKLELTSHMLRRIKLTEEAIEKFAKNKESILEIGCGTGENLSYYVNKFHFKNAYCVEIASSADAEIRKKGITPFILDVNVSKIPLGDASIDVVIFEEVIEHLYNSDLIISEIKRVLKKGGILILSTPNLSSWINRLVLLLGYQPFSHDVSFLGGFGRLKFKDQTNGHIKSFTLKAMLDYLKYFGFNVVEIRGVEADGLSGFLTKIDKVFSRIPSLASHMFIVAENS
ncbi:class I SAM-dependent methyltransferase [Saccharolobus islandicus]|uniref:Methyltransferase type 11 n=1 Tax=Saccharolobus islandicus (strain REY15A) TaxID=930945 RepID=F0NDY3_SACI5|nr:class I SAM-dependent methyltransferase [Sulfolobus islandicus]ADX84919.1 methyltransferase type 11 [Sulfolobus islandicus REY15A]